MSRTGLRVAAIVLLASLLATTGCRPELVSRQLTRVYEDGSLDRVVEMRGKPGDPEETVDDDWLRDEVGVALADPRAWDRVDTAPGRVRAEGFFAEAALLPPVWRYRTDLGEREVEPRTRLEIRDRLLFRLWRYEERHVDPFGPEEVERALDELTRMGAELVRDEIELTFRGEVDPAPVDAWAAEIRALAGDLLATSRRLAGPENDARRRTAWNEQLAQAGLAPAPPVEADAFWDAQVPMLLFAGRQRLAEALSTKTRPVAAEELAFWPLDEDFEAIEAMIARHRDPQAFQEDVERLATTLAGYYGRAGSPDFRFEVAIELPGALLTTNGTPVEGRRALFVFRADALSFGEQVLRAESIRLDAERLRALGGRQDLPPAARLQLVDLLERHDADDRLLAVVARAVDAGSLDLLRDGEALPDDLESRAAELADLLDPAVPLPEPL